MKKISNITLILSILIISSLVYANAGPTYWRGKTSSEILTIEDHTPIKVEKESLIFDFTEDVHKHYSISSRITANYTMYNDSETKANVQMAFPLITSIQNFNPNVIDIKVDGKEIDFKVYLGDMAYTANGRKDDEMLLDFSSIARSISSSEYIPVNYDLNEKGILYTYNVASTSADNISFAIDFFHDEGKGKIMSKGFNGGRIMDNIESVFASSPEGQDLELFLIGGDIDLELKVYSDPELTKETDKYSLDIVTEEITIKDYLNRGLEIFKEGINYSDYLGDNQLFNVLAKELDKDIGRNLSNLGMDALSSVDFMDMFFVLIYEVDFETNSRRNVSISYDSTGTMDRTKTLEPIYSFSYLLNPARNWASFKDLNIVIKPPATSPYIIDSSLDLIRDEDGIYRGKFDTLPESDLNFSLYYNEEITRMDKIKGYLKSNSYMMLPILTWLLSGIIALIIKNIFNKLRKSQ